MRNRAILGIGVLIVGLVAVGTLIADSKQAPSLVVVSEVGTIQVVPPSGFEFPARFSIAAVRHPDGTVNGSGKAGTPGFVAIHVTVECVTFDGNQAWLGGYVRNSNLPDIPVGTEWGWWCQDNGEGAGSPPDNGTTFVFGAPGFATSWCLGQGDPITRGEIQHGNIQVKSRGD